VKKINDNELNQIYQYDAEMLESVNAVGTACSEMENNSASNTDIKQALENVNKLLDDILQRFTGRENILRNL
jgi:hypothetical protein